MLSNSSILCFHLGNTKWYLLLVFTSVTVYAGHSACSLYVIYCFLGFLLMSLDILHSCDKSFASAAL